MVILSLIFLIVKVWQRRKFNTRQKMLEVLESLELIQTNRLFGRGFTDDDFIEVEIAKYWSDFGSFMLVAVDDWRVVRYMHETIVQKYPYLFERYEKRMKEIPKGNRLYDMYDVKSFWMEIIKKFEREHGCLQKQYNIWRQKLEKEWHPWSFTDCGFQEARDRFSKECQLEEEIPFEVMCHYQGIYERGKKFGVP